MPVNTTPAATKVIKGAMLINQTFSSTLGRRRINRALKGIPMLGILGALSGFAISPVLAMAQGERQDTTHFGSVADSSAIVASLKTKYEVKLVLLNKFGTPGPLIARMDWNEATAEGPEFVYEFLEENKFAFGIKEPREGIIIRRHGIDSSGEVCVKVGQRFRGLQVHRTGGTFCMNSNDSSFSFIGELLPDPNISLVPSIDCQVAERAALQYARSSWPTSRLDSSSALSIFVGDTGPQLAWRVKVRFHTEQHWGLAYYVDAVSGELLSADEVNIWPAEGPPERR